MSGYGSSGRQRNLSACAMDGHCKMQRISNGFPGCMGDGKGRSTEQMWSDEKWCEKVLELVL